MAADPIAETKNVLPSLFFNQVYDSREPPFTSKAVYGGKELLKPCEALFPFDFDQGIFVALPRFMPAS